jgi:hypothetical protein
MITAGWILTIVGVLSILISIGLIAGAVIQENEETEVANENDFSSIGVASYRYTITNDRVSSLIRIEIISRSTISISVNVRVVDGLGDDIFQRRGLTPINYEVDVGGDFSDQWDIILEFDNETITLSELQISVIGDEISDQSVIMCCFGGVLPVLGTVMLVVGIILLIVGYRKNSRRNDIQQTPPPEYYMPGNNYSYQQPGYNKFQETRQSGYGQSDPNPYYRGSMIPGSVREPPDQDDYNSQW